MGGGGGAPLSDGGGGAGGGTAPAGGADVALASGVAPTSDCMGIGGPPGAPVSSWRHGVVKSSSPANDNPRCCGCVTLLYTALVFVHLSQHCFCSDAASAAPVCAPAICCCCLSSSSTSCVKLSIPARILYFSTSACRSLTLRCSSVCWAVLVRFSA